MLSLIGTFGLNFPIFISTMAVNVFHSDARAFGLLSSIMAVGALSGALFAAGRKKPGLASLSMGAGVFGLGCTLAALAPGYWWFAAALAVSGAAALTLTNGTNSIMQLSTEPSMRGRVMALRVGIALGGMTNRRPDRRLGCQPLRPALVARSGCRGVLHRCPGRSLRSGPPKRVTARPVISPMKSASGHGSSGRQTGSSGSRPMWSFTVFWNRCLQPRYRSVVWMETWPNRNPIRARSRNLSSLLRL